MVKQTKIIDGLEFKIGTQKLKIYELYKEGKSIPEISELTGFPANNVKWYCYKFKKLSGIVSLESVPSQSTPANILPVYKNGLLLELIQDGENLNLFVQTSKEFENYLKSKHEIISTNNLFGEQKTGEVYRLRFIENSLDDINTPIIYRGQINFGVLRVVGISEGKKFRVNSLLSESQLKLALKKMGLTYKNFYKKTINQEQINIRVEVLEEI